MNTVVLYWMGCKYIVQLHNNQLSTYCQEIYYQEIMTLLAVLGVRSTYIPSAHGEVSWERVGSVIAHRGRHVATTTIFWIMLSDPHTYA